MNSVQILQEDISFIIQEEMPDIAAVFMDDMNIRGPPTHYKTDSSDWYASTAFSDPHSQSAPVPCALSSDGQNFEAIPENTGIHQFTWEHLNKINRVLQHVKKVGGTVGKWTFVYQRLWPLVITALTREVTLRIASFSRL